MKRLLKFLKILIIFSLPILLSMNDNLNKNNILKDDVLITILLTLLGFSIGFLAIFYTFIQLITEYITKDTDKHILELESLKSLKENIYFQFIFLFIVILVSLINDNIYIHNFLKKINLPCFDFLLTHTLQITYFVKILSLFISIYIVFDITKGILNILQKSSNIKR